MKRFICGLMLAALAAGQVSAPESVSVSGVVTNVSGQPVSGATVSLQPELLAAISLNAISSLRGYSGTTDDKGQFVISGVVPGTYRLNVERRGFLPQAYGGRPGTTAGTPIAVQTNRPVSNLKIAMTQPGVITGRLTSPDGEAVARLRVSAVRWSFAGGKRRLQIQGTSGTSDDTGAFRVSGLVPGQYFVYAETEPAEAVKLVTETAQRTYLPTYFPSTVDAGGAVPVSVSAGAESRADIRVRQDRGYTVSGTVMGLQRRPAGGAVVVVLREGEAAALPLETRTTREIRDSPPYSIMVRADAMGRYTIPGVPSGSHRIAAFGGTRVELNLGANSRTVFNNASQGLSADDGAMGISRVSVRDGSLQDVVIQFQPGVEVTRKIRVEETTFADILRAQWKRDGKGPPADAAAKMLALVPRVILVPEQGISAGGWFSQKAEESPTQKVAPGRYRIEISGMPVGVYTKSIRLGGIDVTKRGLDLSGGSTELDIVLTRGSGQIAGSVEDGKGRPVAGATVTLWPVTPNLSQLADGAVAVKADLDGRFTFYNTAPGDYYIVAFEDLPEPGVEIYPGFLARFSGQAARVKLDPFGAASATPRLVTREAAARVIPELR